MNPNSLDEVFRVSTTKGLAEVGGGHDQKGGQFQRHWAVLRMFELEEAHECDFLLLFEAIQDIAELNSSSVPTRICIYQVKKKDRGEWTWHELTALPDPTAKLQTKKGSKKTSKQASDNQTSPIGKLYASLMAFKQLTSAASFISDAGCNLALADGSNAATSLPCALSDLPPQYADLLKKGLQTLHEAGTSIPVDLSKIRLQRVSFKANDPKPHVIGIVNMFLRKRSPKHAGQAEALVDALLVKITPLGAKTDTCKTFDELRQERGFSRSEFSAALGDLESVPDLEAHLESCLRQLADEGMGAMEVTHYRYTAPSKRGTQKAGYRGNTPRNCRP